MTILPQLESELLGAHARRAARRRWWPGRSPSRSGGIAVALAVATTLAVAAVAILLVRHAPSGGGSAAAHRPPATSTPPPSQPPPSLPSNPTRDQRHEEQYLFRAAAAVPGGACYIQVTSPSPAPSVSQGAPSQALLSILGVLRRPAQPTDKLPKRVVGLARQVIPNGSLPPAKGIYVRYIRRARWRFGAGYYIVPAAQVNHADPVRRGCAADLRRALERELPQIPKRLRAPTLALEPLFLAQMRYESEPHQGICLLALNSTGGGAAGCGDTAADIEQGHGIQTGGPTGVPVAYGVIPDGVATVTLYYGRTSFTVHAIENVWILPLGALIRGVPGGVVQSDGRVALGVGDACGRDALLAVALVSVAALGLARRVEAAAVAGSDQELAPATSVSAARALRVIAPPAESVACSRHAPKPRRSIRALSGMNARAGGGTACAGLAIRPGRAPWSTARAPCRACGCSRPRHARSAGKRPGSRARSSPGIASGA